MNIEEKEEIVKVPALGNVLHAPGTLTATKSPVKMAEEQALVDEPVEVIDNDQKAESTCSSPQKVSKRRKRKDSKRRRVSTDSSSQNSSEYYPSTKKLRVSPADLGRQLGEQIHCVIYRVDCHSGPQLTMMYLDVPKRDYGFYGGAHYHLKGSVEVHDLAAFISSAGSLAYLVFRDVKCYDYMRWDMAQGSSSSSGSKLFWKESIALINENLRSCIDGVAQCAPNGSAYGSNSPNYAIYSAERDEPDRDLYELRFFYHHRELLAAGIPSFSSPLKEQVEDILGFLQETYGTVYSETDRLLSQGLIHRDHLEMLFCPNSIVVSKSDSKQTGSLSAFVLRSWPIGQSALTLDCWYWGFDG
jgi:hypothetical protein